MGARCGCGGSEYPEIEDASTMAEISNFLKEKRNLLPIEAKEIEEYIKDNKKIPKHIDVGVCNLFNISSIKKIQI